MIFHVTSSDKQQAVLERFRRVSGLTATGTSEGDDDFVVFECSDEMMRMTAEVLVADIDPGSIQTYSSQVQKVPSQSPAN